MGTVAREIGFQGPLPMLCIPEIGLEFGVKKLKYLLNKYKLPEHAVAAYNAGSLVYSKQGYLINHGYVSKVMQIYEGLLLAKTAKVPTS
jgi:soluble lytic murein transglycosylase-like protein